MNRIVRVLSPPCRLAGSAFLAALLLWDVACSTGAARAAVSLLVLLLAGLGLWRREAGVGGLILLAGSWPGISRLAGIPDVRPLVLCTAATALPFFLPGAGSAGRRKGRMPPGTSIPIGALTVSIVLLSLLGISSTVSMRSPVFFPDLVERLGSLGLAWPASMPLAGLREAGLFLAGLAAFRLVAAIPREDRGPVEKALAGGLVANLVFGVVQGFTRLACDPWFLENEPGVPRLNGLLPDPNTYGSYLVLLAPLALGRAGVFQRIRGWPRTALLTLLAGNLLLTFSRSAYAAAAIGILAMAPAYLLTRRAAAVGLAGIVVAGTAASLWPGLTPPIESRTAGGETGLPGEVNRLLKGRYRLWLAAGDLVAERPVAGGGLGTFQHRIQDAWRERFDDIPHSVEHAHNYFLEWLCDGGVVGSAVLLLAIWAAGRSFAPSRGVPGGEGGIGAAASVGWLATGITWLAGHPMLVEEYQIAFWALAAVAGGAPGAPHTVRARGRSPAAAAGGACLALGVLAVVAGRGIVRPDPAGWLDEYSIGLYGWERPPGSRAFRWSGARAILDLKAEGQSVAVPLCVHHPGSEQEPVFVELVANGNLVDRLPLLGGQWRIREFTLPSPCERVLVEIRPASTWRPSDKGPSADQRSLGVAVGRIRIGDLPLRNLTGLYEWSRIEASPPFQLTAPWASWITERSGRFLNLAVNVLRAVPEGSEPITARFFLDGRAYGPIVFREREWRMFALDVPPGPDRTLLTLLVRPSINLFLAGLTSDRRELGIALGPREWLDAPAPGATVIEASKTPVACDDWSVADARSRR